MIIFLLLGIVVAVFCAASIPMFWEWVLYHIRISFLYCKCFVIGMKNAFSDPIVKKQSWLLYPYFVYVYLKGWFGK